VAPTPRRRNPAAASPLATATVPLPAGRRAFHDPSYPAAVILPVL